MAVYIALLRGINVGGKNKVKMADLKAALEQEGFHHVQTYIQSGNIVFESADGEEAVQTRIEQIMEAEFGIASKVMVRTAGELTDLAAKLPFTADEIAAAEASCEGECLYAAFLREPLPPAVIGKLDGGDYGDDQYRTDGRHIYLLYGRSVRNSKLSAKLERLGVPITVRNWNTVGKLIGLAVQKGN
ncbi:DUF1697 domain-containing protein [Paenibacillus protaetiae]|uniref:DUF1697 domain-containing protein n=2 Tax=Paenibacillus protaetiae TaxID=2509456 RepID=A0A4P6EZV9_9BACL|nr:DUF1697 domain-containing protein [Paenibacillus protaetiae]